MAILILHSWILPWWKFLVIAGVKVYLRLTHFRPMFSLSKSIWKPEVFKSFQTIYIEKEHWLETCWHNLLFPGKHKHWDIFLELTWNFSKYVSSIRVNFKNSCHWSITTLLKLGLFLRPKGANNRKQWQVFIGTVQDLVLRTKVKCTLPIGLDPVPTPLSQTTFWEFSQ